MGKRLSGKIFRVFLLGLLLCILGPGGRPAKAYAKNAAEPESITLNEKTVTLLKGRKAVLSAKILPAGAAGAKVQWISKDPKVAKVSAKGRITAVSYGETKIVARTENGLRAVCKVRVVIPPKKLSLNYTAVSLTQGKTLRLRASVSPARAAGAKIRWKSSNEKVVSVDSSGNVTALSQGTAVIFAAAENGVNASCVVRSVMQYKISGRTLAITSAEGIKTYYAYSQKDYGYGWCRSYGCVTTAVSVVASSYGKYYTPKEIHDAPASAAYSERYAVIKMGEASTLPGWYGKAAISVRTASNILTNMGIKNKAVYSYDRAEAVEEIREHLKAGKPVIIKANNNVYNGLQLGYPHHAIVLAGIDEKDHLVCVNRGSAYLTTYTLSTLLYHHMTPASGKYTAPYVGDLKTAGGYILIG